MINTTDYSARIMEACGPLEAHPLLSHVPPALRVQMAKRMAYSAKHRFCYFRIPKAANSTTLLTLCHHAGIPTRDHSRHPERAIKKARKAFRDIPTVAALAQAYCFTIVRNPYTRVLSAYRDKAAREKYINLYGLRHTADPRRKFTFLDFLRRLEDGLLRSNPHWAPQLEILPYELDRLDLVGRVESIERDLDCAIRAIFGVPLQLQMRAAGRTMSERVLDQYVGAEEKTIIRRLYAADFDRLYPDAA